MTQPVLKTERLFLRPFRNADAESVFAYTSDQEVAKTCTWNAPRTVEDSRGYLGWIESVTCLDPDKLFFVWAITLDDDRVVGSIDFRQLSTFSGQVDYALARELWGQGLVTEAVSSVRDWAFESLEGLVRLQAMCLTTNSPSMRVLEKCGMRLEGIRRKGFQLKGEIVDLAQYSILREEWNAARD